MNAEDANAEFELIRRARIYNEENGYGKNLERDEGARSLLEVASDTKKRYSWVKSDNKDLLKEVISSVREDANEGNELTLTPGGEQMSRQNTGDSMIKTTSSRGRNFKGRNPA
jgi:hypothetical protein